MPLRLSAFVCPAALAGSLVLGALPTSSFAARARLQQTTAANTQATDPAYLNGYNSGYSAGEQDRQRGLAANPHKFRAYQLGTVGYQSSYGTRADYRSAFRSGFEDGYGDGYNERPNSTGAAVNQPAASPSPAPVTQAAPATATTPVAQPATGTQAASANAPAAGTPAPAPNASTSVTTAPTAPAPQVTPTPTPAAGTPPSSPGAAPAPASSTSTPQTGTPPTAATTLPAPPAYSADKAKHATAVGYREGYSAGEFDANRNTPANYQKNNEYTRASAGYTDEYAPLDEYQNNFRDGFRLGYDDGYNHRLYNSQIGLRITESAAASHSPTNAVAPQTAANGTAPAATINAAANSAPANNLTLPEGTEIHVRLDNELGTKTNHAGDGFTASVSIPVWVGAIAAIPAGSKIQGTVENVQRAGRLKGTAQLQLRYDTIAIPGGPTYQLAASTSGIGEGAGSAHTDQQEGTIKGKGSGAGGTVAKSSGIGAVIGAITGGGLKGAVVGGAVGAGVGTAGVMMSRGRDIELPEGEALTLRLDRPLQLQTQRQAPQ